MAKYLAVSDGEKFLLLLLSRALVGFDFYIADYYRGNVLLIKFEI